MRSFTDNSGDVWSIELLRPQLKQVNAELGIDLLDLGNQALFQRLRHDPALIADVISVLLADQIRSRGLDEIQFARRIKGEPCDRAAQALLEELIDFFPPRRQTALREALAKLNALTETAMTAVEAALSDGRLERKMEQTLGEIFGGSISNGPSTPESIPTNTP